MRNCVLVVERDPSVSRFMQLKLEEEGFSCLVDNIGDSVVDLAGQRQVDIIVLDPDDPMEDGDKILENVREISTIPIIYLSSDGSVDRKVEVLNAGADDYLTKPFYLEELKMRIQALLKRSGKFNENTLSYGDLTVNLSTNEVKVQDASVELLGKEFELLVYFLQNQNVILPKTQIFDRLWGFDSDTTISVVEVYVSKVRKKLKGSTFAENLQTLRSVGYILKHV